MILLLPVFDFSNIVICQWFGEKKKKKKKKKKKEKKKKKKKKKRKERKKKRNDKLSYPLHDYKTMRIETTLAFDHRYKHITLIR